MPWALYPLIVTSTSLVGLLAMWAATSTRHWSVRTAVIGGALSALLLIPAHELFVCFGAQALLVAAVITATRGTRCWKHPRLAQNRSAGGGGGPRALLRSRP